MFLKNVKLIKLGCSFNQITSLDLRNNTQLTDVDARNNQLTRFDIRNGQYMNFSSKVLLNNNNSLSCISITHQNQADAHNNSTPSGVDSGVFFATIDCFAKTYVPDDNFEAYLETHDASGNTVTLGHPSSMGDGIANNDSVLTLRISGVTTLDVNNQSIADLTGIEDFSDLILWCVMIILYH